MKKNRDDFSAAIIKTLERRASGKCSNPEHRISTSGPTNDPEKSNNIGVAAHIKAAAPGGPRYDPEMTPKERANIHNAIWLCSNCATLIDRDEKKYTVQVLHEWKRTSEALNDEDFGKTPISKSEYNTLRTMVFGNLEKNKIANAVSSICNMSATELKKIDPRFDVDVAYIGGKTCIGFHAKEDVPAVLHVASDFVDEFSRKFQDLKNFGKSLEIDGSAVRLEGSKLFEFDFGERVKFSMHSERKKTAALNISILNKQNNILQKISEIQGEVTIANKVSTFQGFLFGKMFSIVLEMDIFNGFLKLHWQGDFDYWNGRELNLLPYFDKVYDFHHFLCNGSVVKFSLEIEGLHILTSEEMQLDQKDDSNGLFDTYRYLRYLRNLRDILKKMTVNINYKKGIVIPFEQVEAVEELYFYLFEYGKSNGREMGKGSFKLTVLPAVISDVEKMQEKAQLLKFVQNFKKLLKYGEIEIPVPPLSFTFTDTYLRSRLKKIKPGKSYRFDICPSPTCRVYVDFDLQTQQEFLEITS